MIEWMSGQRERPMNFDGTFASLISIYQRDPESPYKKPQALVPAPLRCVLPHAHARDRRAAHRCVRRPRRSDDGLRRGASLFCRTADRALPQREWRRSCSRRHSRSARHVACPAVPNSRRRIEDIRFKAPAPRQEAPSAAEIVRLRQLPVRSASASRACLRIAIRGVAAAMGRYWRMDTARRSPASASSTAASKWIGPTWSQIDDNLVLRITPGKTEGSSQARVILDLRCLCDGDRGTRRRCDRSPQRPADRQSAHRPPISAMIFPRVWRRSAAAAGVSQRRSGIATSAPAALPRRVKPARRPTMLPRPPAIPASEQRRGSMTAIRSKLPAGSLRPGPRTAETEHKRRGARSAHADHPGPE